MKPKVFIKKFSPGNISTTIEEALDWINIEKIIRKEDRVFIKPNFTYPIYKEGVTTSPLIIEGLIKLFSEFTSNIIVGESDGGYYAWKAEEAFKGHSLYEIAHRYGAKLVNLSNIETEVTELKLSSKTIINVPLPRLLLHEIDVFITVPVPKVHVMTNVSLGFKNQWGCIPDTMRLMYHYLFDEMIIALNKILNPKIVIFDGTYFLDRTGPMDGDPVPMNLIIASNDIGAGSLVCCEIMNIDPEKVKHLRLARKEGMLPYSLEEICLNIPTNNFKVQKFRLERTIINWIALAVFNSKIGLKFVYDSPLSGVIRWLINAIRGRRDFKAGY